MVLPYLCFIFFCSHRPLLDAAEKKKHRIKDNSLQHCNQPLDINEPIQLLCKYAKACSSVVEIGNKEIAAAKCILQGLSESSFKRRSYLKIYSVYPPSKQTDFIKEKAKKRGINFTFWQANDFLIVLEPTDMLYIDSLHTYCHLTYQLETFSSQVRRYICLHGTSGPWCDQEENAYQGNYDEYPFSYDRKKKGLWPAVLDFLANHPEWVLVERSTKNEGCAVLQRLDETTVKDPYSPPLVDSFLKNKIILCTGPALGRYEMLKNSTEADMGLIPFKKIFVTTNEPSIKGIIFREKEPNSCYLIPNRGKHLDCLNCIISTMRSAVNDPDIQDDDIILFKHESVFLLMTLN